MDWWTRTGNELICQSPDVSGPGSRVKSEFFNVESESDLI